MWFQGYCVLFSNDHLRGIMGLRVSRADTTLGQASTKGTHSHANSHTFTLPFRNSQLCMLSISLSTCLYLLLKPCSKIINWHFKYITISIIIDIVWQVLFIIIILNHRSLMYKIKRKCIYFVFRMIKCASNPCPLKTSHSVLSSSSLSSSSSSNVCMYGNCALRP